MRNYNVILIYNPTCDKILLCKREKEPYKGLLNMVGGKIEEDESGFCAAYRELFEETGIRRSDVFLHHFMDFTYYITNCTVEVYVGKLKHDIDLIEEENELLWSDLNHNFFDSSIYAGEGNIGHIIEEVNLFKDILFN